MPTALTILLVVALLAGVLFAVFVWRLRAIAGRVGSFACSLRAGSRWVPGVAMYTQRALVWYDVVSLSRRPRHSWDRCELDIVRRSTRPPDHRGQTLVEAHCLHHGEELDIAAPAPAFEGLVSWLESSPPGERSSRVI